MKEIFEQNKNDENNKIIVTDIFDLEEANSKSTNSQISKEMLKGIVKYLKEVLSAYNYKSTGEESENSEDKGNTGTPYHNKGQPNEGEKSPKTKRIRKSRKSKRATKKRTKSKAKGKAKKASRRTRKH